MGAYREKFPVLKDPMFLASIKGAHPILYLGIDDSKSSLQETTAQATSKRRGRGNPLVVVRATSEVKRGVIETLLWMNQRYLSVARSLTEGQKAIQIEIVAVAATIRKGEDMIEGHTVMRSEIDDDVKQNQVGAEVLDGLERSRMILFQAIPIIEGADARADGAVIEGTRIQAGAHHRLQIKAAGGNSIVAVSMK
mmetsp:Transcript_12394/g.20992  ORF Transcript_12394/g.20992 Transcript_12394/m.20992 type:complete len:195 (-) Transcript_12394:1585-2169(-)